MTESLDRADSLDSVAGYEITKTGLICRDGWTPELWEAAGREIALYQKGLMWLVGDWLTVRATSSGASWPRRAGGLGSSTTPLPMLPGWLRLLNVGNVPNCWTGRIIELLRTTRRRQTSCSGPPKLKRPLSNYVRKSIA